MSSHVVGQTSLDTNFHFDARQTPFQGLVRNYGKQSRPCVITIFFDKYYSFRQQLHTAQLPVLPPAVFQPQCPVIVHCQVVESDGHHIHVRGSSITGEKEHVPDNGVFRAASGKLYIPYLLEILLAQCSWSCFLLLG